MRIVVPLWLAILTVVSLASDDFKYHLGTKGPFHHTAHLLAFAITGLMFCWTANSLRSRLLRALAACFTALVLEWMEALFYNNVVEWHDVWIGCLGVALGLALSIIVQVTRPSASFVRK
jgi:hypothetical protein